MRKGNRRTSYKNRYEPRRVEVRDFYDKLEAWGKVGTAIVVVLISIIGSLALSKFQNKSQDTQLFSQFMSEREKADSDVRKDMFEKVLRDFWITSSEAEGECVLERIDRQLLQLDLLSRNFHETLDMSPLFNHVLLNINSSIRARDLIPNRDQSESKTASNQKSCRKQIMPRLKRNDLINYLTNKNIALKQKQETAKLITDYMLSDEQAQQKAGLEATLLSMLDKQYENSDMDTKRIIEDIQRSAKSILASPRQRKKLQTCQQETEPSIIECLQKITKNMEIGKIRERKRNQLIAIARRITAKQMESLTEVAAKVHLIVNLEKTCKDKKPFEHIDSKDNCETDNHPYKIVNVEKYQACKISLDDGGEIIGIQVETNVEEEAMPGRCMNITIERSYPRWDQLYVTVVTAKTDKEQALDPGHRVEKSSFWLGYYDFPLSDNTYLSSKERYAVVLNKFDDMPMDNGNAQEKTEQAEVSLIYFPASYAGFKEKAFYQQQFYDTLIKH